MNRKAEWSNPPSTGRTRFDQDELLNASVFEGDPRRRPNRLGDYLYWLVALACIVAFGTGVVQLWLDAACNPDGAKGASRPALFPPFEGRECVRFLLLGTDDKVENGRSDTMILATLYPQRRRVVAVSIPRDSLVRVPGHGRDRINVAYRLGGAKLAVRTVSALLPSQTLDYYVRCDFEGFQKMVDVLGGVEIEVERNMRYIDRSQKLYIDLKKGRQRLNGYDAMCYVRYRSDGRGDIGRTERQQKFLRAALSEMMKLSTLPKALKIIKAMRPHVESNLGAKQVADLARVLPGIRGSDLVAGTLPGKPKMIGGRSCWELDPVGGAEMLRDLSREATAKAGSRPLVVEVLNGCGVTGAAEAVAAQMKQQGFEVARTGNAESFTYRRSEIRCYVEHGNVGERIKQVLRCGTIVQVDEKPTDSVQATIIIGRDLIRV